MKTENMTKEQANLIRLINDGLAEVHTKKIEYQECAVDGNPNWEYFKGKADAYEYAYKTFKRILEWTASGSVAAPKEPKEESEKANRWLTDRGYVDSHQFDLINPSVPISRLLQLYAEQELSSLRDQLRQRDELINEMVATLKTVNSLVDIHGLNQYIPQGNLDSLIKKSHQR